MPDVRHRARDRRELGGETADRLRADPARARARVPPAGASHGRSGNSGTAGTSWRFRSGHGLDAWLVEFGPDVVVLEPAELRADVVDRLRAVAKG
ncbi:WYL domain-containing protein [Streptomyces sp. L7]